MKRIATIVEGGRTVGLVHGPEFVDQSGAAPGASTSTRTSARSGSAPTGRNARTRTRATPPCGGPLSGGRRGT